MFIVFDKIKKIIQNWNLCECQYSDYPFCDNNKCPNQTHFHNIKTPKVFLGGTCNESRWRDDLIKRLKIDYFNPVVEDWTPQCQDEEIKQRSNCDYVLYCITPKMTGVYSIAEVIDDSNKRPRKTLFIVLNNDDGIEFSQSQLKSLNAVKKMVTNNGGLVFDTLQEIANFLNEKCS